MTDDNITKVGVLIHYYDNVPIQFNEIPIHNDQNNTSIEEPIDVHTLEVYNPKSCAYLQPQGHHYLEKYKELPHPLCYFFVLFYLFILLEAMNKSALDKLRREARKRESEKKVEASRKEQIEKERAKQVHLIRVIYIKPLASCEPIAEDIRTFEQEHKNMELKQELEIALNFLK